jgi:hypothetical protein
MLFYCQGVGKITFGCFLLDRCFNILTSRYAKNTQRFAVLYNAKFRIRAVPQRAGFWSLEKFYLRFRSMRVWNPSKIFSCRLRAKRHSWESTLCYAS